MQQSSRRAAADRFTTSDCAQRRDARASIVRGMGWRLRRHHTRATFWEVIDIGWQGIGPMEEYWKGIGCKESGQRGSTASTELWKEGVQRHEFLGAFCSLGLVRRHGRSQTNAVTRVNQDPTILDVL